MKAEDLNFAPEKAEEFRRQGHWKDETLVSVLAAHAAETPDNIAIISQNSSITYAELMQKVRSLATGLEKLGLQKGDVVAAQLPNTEEYIITLAAVAAIGGVFQTIHVPYKGNDLEFLVGHGKARAFVCLPGNERYSSASAILALGDALPDLDFVITTGKGPEGTHEWAELAAGEPAELDLNRLQPEDPHTLLYTSGTTSNPKGVPHCSLTILSGVRTCADELNITSDDRMYMLSNYTHMWGICGLMMGLYKGASIVLSDKFSPEVFVEITESLKPTVAIGAPVHILKTYHEKFFEGRDMSSLRLIVTSGGPFAQDQLKAVGEALPNTQISELWGMTEVTPGAVTRPGTPFEESVGTVGQPLPHCEFRIMSEEGEDLTGTGQPGELQMNGSCVFSGYLDNPEVNAKSFTEDGWFLTGDIASIDGKNMMRIQGRTKEVINRGGIKFMTLEIEDALLGHPCVEACAVVPMPDQIFGERACCVAVLKPDTEVTLEELCEHLDGKGLEKVKWPERLEIVDQMPMTSTGKIMKGRLEDMVKAKL